MDIIELWKLAGKGESEVTEKKAAELLDRIEFNLKVFDEYDEEIGQIKNVLLELKQCCIGKKMDEKLLEIPFQLRNSVSNFGKDDLENFLSDCRELIICDAGFLKNYSKNRDNLTEIIPEAVKLTLYFSSKNSRKENVSQFRKDFLNSTLYDVSFLNEKVWIKNRSEAILIGTSFAGTESKPSFLMDLTEKAFAFFMSELAVRTAGLKPTTEMNFTFLDSQ